MLLKLIRDGYEDYEYLSFLSEHEMDDEARTIAASLFPATFETSRTDAQLQAARKQLPRRNLASGLIGGHLSRSDTVRISSYFRTL